MIISELIPQLDFGYKIHYILSKESSYRSFSFANKKLILRVNSALEEIYREDPLEIRQYKINLLKKSCSIKGIKHLHLHYYGLITIFNEVGKYLKQVIPDFELEKYIITFMGKNMEVFNRIMIYQMRFNQIEHMPNLIEFVRESSFFDAYAFTLEVYNDLWDVCPQKFQFGNTFTGQDVAIEILKTYVVMRHGKRIDTYLLEETCLLEQQLIEIMMFFKYRYYNMIQLIRKVT
ncbi:MAG: hypothetical protein JXR88_07275 [Clostridia bacterium]|nr:hypothetical protein [Clostridia bacterium]